MRKIWPFSVNFFIYAAFSTAVPFFVLYYQKLGFSGAQIGLMTGVTPLITLFSSPFWTGLADRTRKYRLVMGGVILVAVAVLFVFPMFRTFAPIFTMVILFNTFISPAVAFTDAATMHMLGERKDLYGRVRLGGTFGYGIAAAVAGVLVERYGLDYAFFVSGGLFFLAFVFSQRLEFASMDGDGQPDARIWSLLRSPRWVLFLSISLAGGIGFSAANIYFYSFMAELGARESVMGLALTIGTISEIPILFFGDRLLRWLKPFRLLVIAGLITGARLLLLAGSSSPEMALVIQLLNGLTLTMMWIAGVAYADEQAPANLKATAQGLYGAANFGIGSALGGFLGGLLLGSMGARGLFIVFGLIILGIVAVAGFFHTRIKPAPAGELATG